MRYFILMALLLVASPAFAQVTLPEEHLACESDADCVVIQTSGCSCLCLSEDFQPVNRNFAGQDTADENCSDANLKQCAVMGMCGHPAPHCVDNRCVIN